jgi:hypothetical protein
MGKKREEGNTANTNKNGKKKEDWKILKYGKAYQCKRHDIGWDRKEIDNIVLATLEPATSCC